MARKTVIVLEDDLTGQLLDEGRGETVPFGLDDQSYEIDLSGDNAREFREALSKYTGAGRKQSTTSRPPKSASTGQFKDAQNTTLIREWATANGYQVSERGRLPRAVTQAYAQSH